jgi:hypothetical protein
MPGLIGNAQLLRPLNKAVKEHYQENRPFMVLVINAQGYAEVHSNMDVNQQRIHLLEMITQRLKEVGDVAPGQIVLAR